VLLVSMIVCIGQSMALMSVIPTNGHRAGCKLHHHYHLLHKRGRIVHPSICSLKSAKGDDFDDALDEDGYSDAKGSGEDDDIGADAYFDKFISEALKEDEIRKGRKPKRGSKVASPPSDDDDDNAKSETKKMMEQQQKQIDLLMKLVQQQQGGQQLPHTTSTRTMSTDEIRQQSPGLSATTTTHQKSINVAPLKAMLFIDGTWLYYSINTRNPKRDPIISKFGLGWQNNYKVDWLALPRLICTQIENQKDSKTSFTGSDRPLEIARVMVFTSAKKQTDPNSLRMRMFREMANANYDVHMMETVGKGEKCVDIQLAVEMLHYATVPNAYDVAILLSGDKDFVPALVRTRQKGKQVCISSMRAGCNRVLYESPHIRDYDVVWLENCLDDLIVPIPPDERSRRDRAGYASSFTMMRVVRDFVESVPDNEWVSSRDIGNYLKMIEITDSNMLDELKQAHGGLRTFFMERACNLFDTKFPDPGAIRGRGEFSFWVRVKGDSDETLLNEFKRTQFFTKEEKEFLESYKKETYLEDEAYRHTTTSANYLGVKDSESDAMDESSEDSELSSYGGMASSSALDYSQLTVVRLKDVCREKGLPVSGKKNDLIERLEHDRKIEHEVVEKQRKEAREAAMEKRSAKTPPRPKEMSTASKPAFSMDSSSQTGNNIYASALPQMDMAGHRTPRSSAAPADPAVAAHLEALIKEYLTASGGLAGSRDIGRYLAANGDSRKGGSRSALTELKETYGSFLGYIRSREDAFSVLDDQQGYGGDHGFPIKLKQAS